MFRLQRFRASHHLWKALFLAIAINDESLQVEILEFFGIVHCLGRHDLAAKANRIQSFSIDGFSNIRDLSFDTDQDWTYKSGR